MDIPLRTDAPRSIDTESRPGVDTRNPADAGGFGEMFAEVRQRDIDREEDRDTPPPGTEAAFAGQTVPQPVRPSTPAAEESGADRAAESESANAVAAAGGKDSDVSTAEAPAAPALSPSTSPENFAALLESSANSLATTALQAPAGDALAAAALATPATPPPPAQAAVTPPVTATIAPPLHSPAWPAAFNNTMRVLVTDQTQVARLQLTPGDLGPVDVRIAISEHRAEIAFAVSSPEAKAAIQQALPQLRETFAASGLQLGDASFGESARGGGNDPAPKGAGWPDNGQMSGETAAPLPATRAVGLIDLYA